MARRATGSERKEPAIRVGALDDITMTLGGEGERSWGKLVAKVENCPLEQTWSYGMAIGAGSIYQPVRCTFHRQDADEKQDPIALAQVIALRLPGGAARLVKLVRGPVFLQGEVSETEHLAVYKLIAERWPMRRLNWLFWTPELADTDESFQLLRSLGYRRTVTGYSTSWVDLNPEMDDIRKSLSQNWRNQLVRAEKEKLKIRSSHGGPALEWLIEKHDAYRKQRRLRAPSGSFAAAMAVLAERPQDVIVLRAERGSDPLAGVMLLKHGVSATYHIAWTGEDGRKAHAHNLLLWEGLKQLKTAGVASLDLGGLDASMEGVSRFKLGIGGSFKSLVGTWL